MSEKTDDITEAAIANTLEKQQDYTLREGDACPVCGGKLVLKHVAKSSFLGCSNYPSCDFTYALQAISHNIIYKTLDLTCPKCHAPLCIRGGRYGVFIGCSNYPQCNFIYNLNKVTQVACPMCQGGILEQRRSRSNKSFYGCSNYPKCKFTLAGEPIAKSCPECGFPVVFKKKTTKGYKIACANSLCSSRHKRKSLDIDIET